MSSRTSRSCRASRTDRRPRFGRLCAVVAAAFVSAVVAVGAAVPQGAARADDAAPPAVAVGVATRPAGADGMPDGRTRLEYASDPGQTVTDQVLVGNTGTQREDFTVYATDAFNAANGDFSLLATADTPKDLGSWVHFENGESRIQFSLDPDQVRLVTFTVSFPADATPGDHVGGVVASVLDDSAQIKVDRRVATAMFARVSGELQPRLTVASFDASYQGDWWNPFTGTVKVLYTVDNPGNVALAANFGMLARTWFGLPASSEQGGSVPVLLPGNSATYEFDIQGVGQWLYLNPGITLTPYVDSNDTAMQLPLTPTTRDTFTIAVPWTLVILAAAVVGIVLLLRWRRRVNDRRAQEWIAYTEAQAAAAAQDAAVTPESATVGAGGGSAGKTDGS